MRKVVLIFPDTFTLSDFLLEHKVSNAEVNTKESSLIAFMEDDDIISAINEYSGHLNVELNTLYDDC